jgi:hypothetical protein
VATETLGIRSVDVISPTDAWAVGLEGKALHWEGDRWEPVSTPTTLPLLSVDMISSTEGWAVGGKTIDDIIGLYSGIIVYWNGATWATFAATDYVLESIDMLSASDGWVGGGTIGTSELLHWNGSTWHPVAHPANTTLRSVSMASTDVGWTAGPYYTDGHPTFLSWDGAAWTNTSLPTQERLWFVSAFSSEEAWVVTHGGGILLRQAIWRTHLPHIEK